MSFRQPSLLLLCETKQPRLLALRDRAADLDLEVFAESLPDGEFGIVAAVGVVEGSDYAGDKERLLLLLRLKLLGHRGIFSRSLFSG